MTNPKQKIGIFGGSFNPPHIGHLVCAQWVYEQLHLDKIVFLPSGIPPHQHKKETICGKHRKEMTRRAISPYPYFELDSIEVDTPKKHYTFDTITALKEKYDNAKLYFIIGGDMVDDLKTWYRIDELVELVQFVGVNRPGSKMVTPYSIQVVEAPLMAISSSLIRQRVQERNPVDLLLPTGVLEYIEAEKLYSKEDVYD